MLPPAPGRLSTETVCGSSSLIYSLAIDPSAPQTVYAGTIVGRVFKSTNSGGNWNPINTGLTNTFVFSLAID
mgnify:CR=1 FL=1